MAEAAFLAGQVAVVTGASRGLGQAIAVVAVPLPDAGVSAESLTAACRRALPGYMVPATIVVRHDSLPRNPNGKIDRKLLQAELAAPQLKKQA